MGSSYPHSSLGYRPPAEFKRDWLERQSQSLGLSHLYWPTLLGASQSIVVMVFADHRCDRAKPALASSSLFRGGGMGTLFYLITLT
jgi:hypothetical protein